MVPRPALGRGLPCLRTGKTQSLHKQLGWMVSLVGCWTAILQGGWLGWKPLQGVKVVSSLREQLNVLRLRDNRRDCWMQKVRESQQGTASMWFMQAWIRDNGEQRRTALPSGWLKELPKGQAELGSICCCLENH